MSFRRFDPNELERMRNIIPVGKCIDMDVEQDGEKVGMMVCRTNENDFNFHSKDGRLKGEIKEKDL